MIMETIPKNRILEWPNNVLKDIKKIHNLDDPGRMEDALNILQQWIQKQDHFLKKDFSKEFLERCIIQSKGSVEKTKKQIDTLCTMRTLLPIYFSLDVVKTDLNDLLDVVNLVVLPKMTNDFYRIITAKFTEKSFTEQTLIKFFQIGINVADYLKGRDYQNGVIIIYDLQKHNLADLCIKLNPVMLQEYITLLTKGYGVRIKSVNIITQSKTIELLLKIIKPFVPKKIADRIHIHKSLEELHREIPKDILPEDYEGKEKSIARLSSDLIDELCTEEHVEYMKMMSKAKTNEELRSSEKFNDEYMGMPGSFRNLSVD